MPVSHSFKHKIFLFIQRMKQYSAPVLCFTVMVVINVSGLIAASEGAKALGAPVLLVFLAGAAGLMGCLTISIRLVEIMVHWFKPKSVN